MLRGLRSSLAALIVVICLAACGTQGSASTPTPTPSTSRIALPAHPTAYFFGDSWTQGYSAASGKGYAYVASKALGWNPVFAPDGSGTGYVHANTAGAPTFPERAAALPAHVTADVVVLQGGLNDTSGPLSRFDGAVKATVATLRQRTGGAPIIILGPAPASAPVSYELYQIDAQLAADAQALGVPYISPIRGNWITAKNVGALIDPVTFHPNTAGHAYFGAKVAAAIRSLIVHKS